MSLDDALVLLVEDDILQRIDLRDQLVELGYGVAEADGAVDALGWLLEREDISAIVIDIDMPGPLEGADLVRLMAEVAPDIPIIVISARGRALSNALRQLPKPYFPTDLADAVAAAIPVAGLRPTG